MSHNQSRGDKNEPPQYRRSVRSGNPAPQRNFFGGVGGGGKGGGSNAPPSSSSSQPANRGGKKVNNVQGGQPRASGSNVNVNVSANLDSSISFAAAAARAVPNGSHSQPPVRGGADVPVTGAAVKLTDATKQKSTPGVPKVPSSNVAASLSDATAPATPAKAPGDPSRPFPLQFGSISPGFMNGVQIPVRTNSAPPDFDEQKRDQARHASLRGSTSTFPTPIVPKQQLPKQDAGTVDQSNITEPHPIPKAKRDVHVTAPPAVAQTQKLSGHPIPGISMPMPFHQSQLPMQYGGPNPQMQSQAMVNSSMPIPIPIPLPMGNPPQVQPQVFVPGIQHHPLQPQGIMHQAQSLNFSSQMGPSLAPQLGNMGMGLGPQYHQQQQQQQQQQAGKYGGARKTVKITHPDTHEELRLDRNDAYGDSGPSVPRSRPSMPPPQSQPIPTYPPVHPMNFYPNSYNASPIYFPSPGSVTLTSPQIPPSSQAPRFNQVTIKPASSLHGEKVGDLPLLNRANITTARGKKKNKEMLQKADAQPLLNRAKSTTARGKKKKKEMLQKPAAQGTAADLYNAQELAPVTVSVPGTTSEVEGEGMESNSSGLASPSAVGSKDKSLPELNRAKSTTAKVKKKKKKKKKNEMLQKADAQGTTADLYSAYKGPEEKRAVPDDWEDAADISTPKLETPHGLKLHGEDESEGMTKKYSRDFLLKFSEQCNELPGGFEITSDIEAFIASNVNIHRESPLLNSAKSTKARGKKKKKEMLQKAAAQGTTADLYNAYKGPEEKRDALTSTESTESPSITLMQVSPDVSEGELSINDKPVPNKPEPDDWEDADIGYGGNMQGFRPGPGGGNYGVLRNPRAQTPTLHAGGILSGPMQSLSPQGGVQRNNIDSDRWQRSTSFHKGLLPSPQTPLQTMHKA